MLRRTGLVSLMLAVFIAAPAAAAVLWVSPAGLDAPAGRGSQGAPYATMAYACARAAEGDTVRLSAGEFRETAQTVLKSRLTVTGSGAGTTIVYAPSAWDFRADLWSDNAAGYVLRAENIRDCAVSGMELRGNGGRANGALLCTGSERVTFRDCAVRDFRYTGLNLSDSRALEIAACTIENSGFERGKDPATPFPDGGSLGNIMARGLRASRFADIAIRTTDLHGYGLKMSALDTCEFARMSFDLYPFQSWNSPIGSPGAGNFDLEIHGGHVTMTAFHHCRFTATLSIMGGTGALYDAVDYSVHLHHNLFDLGGDYGIELGTDKMVLDHNYFRDTWTCMQNYGNATTRISGLTFCHNICENIGMRVIGSAGMMESVRFFNNTVVMANDGGQGYLFTQEYDNGSRNWFIANNAITGDPQSGQNQIVLSLLYGGATAHVRNVYVTHNCFVNLRMAVQGDNAALDNTAGNYVFADNRNENPGFPRPGAKPAEAFMPGTGQPVVDRGDSAWGMYCPYAGATRDMGAYEFGQTAWNVGPGSSDTCGYVWAPVSSVTQEFFVESLRVDLRTSTPGAQIRYTLDGSEPGRSATLYTGPVLITQPCRMRARAFKGDWASPNAFIRDLSQGVQGYPNLALGAACRASSVYPERTAQGDLLYGCEKAIDGEYYSWVGWAPDGGDNLPWLRLTLARPAALKYVELFTRAGVDGGAATRRNFAIQASNDSTFTTFATLASQGATALPFEGVFRATVSDPNTYRYVRAAKTVAGEGFFITELRVHGDTAGAAVRSCRGAAPKAPAMVWAVCGPDGALEVRLDDFGRRRVALELAGLDGRVRQRSEAVPEGGRCTVRLARSVPGVCVLRVRAPGGQEGLALAILR